MSLTPALCTQMDTSKFGIHLAICTEEKLPGRQSPGAVWFARETCLRRTKRQRVEPDELGCRGTCSPCFTAYVQTERLCLATYPTIEKHYVIVMYWLMRRYTIHDFRKFALLILFDVRALTGFDFVLPTSYDCTISWYFAGLHTGFKGMLAFCWTEFAYWVISRFSCRTAFNV